MENKVYQIVTEKILAELAKGVIPWRKPWRGGGLPVNFASKKAYRGINVWLLSLAGYASPYWLSYKQAAERGGQVRKGEHGQLVIFWKFIDYKKTDEAGKEKIDHFPMLRYYTVFNVEQIDGLKLPEDKEALDFQPLDLCEAVVDGYMDAPEIGNGTAQAYYKPGADTVNMPAKASFGSVAGYYSTLFHELGHSTGSAERLAREGFDGASFGSDDYSKEELVAEFTASFLAGACGIDGETVNNSAAYIANWSKKLAENAKLVVCAAAQAQKAADYILGIYHDQKEEG